MPDPEDSGFKYFCPDEGVEWAPNHPIESGENPWATEIRPMTYGAFRRLLREAPTEGNEKS
jgi:hypothetical protein